MLRQLKLLVERHITYFTTEWFITILFVLQHVIAKRELARVGFAALVASEMI